MEAGRAVPLRGDLMDTRKTDLMEELHNAHFTATAATAGCEMAKPRPDNGIDWLVSHHSSHHTIGLTSRLEVQLRSTSRIAAPDSEFFSFPIDARTFDRLTEASHVPRLLVVCLLPKDVDQWVCADRLSNSFHLRHLSYWLRVKPEHRTGKTESTLHIPTVNIFDDIALCDIMCRVGKGEDL
jgi:hypothetical protein